MQAAVVHPGGKIIYETVADPILADIITHHLPLSEVEHGYKIFRNKEEDCVKVVLKP